ncbi:hypothetical protein [Conexibacter sp. SYSU D00693]|uniref:hypothetical protein n=1 Tax=Conexibacter sp. SYSU D00693 TaxID=2812560 RepID=UPI00196AAAD7|nr:hypothetical protein [Conexibacter sp. SYSU D00693]
MTTIQTTSTILFVAVAVVLLATVGPQAPVLIALGFAGAVLVSALARTDGSPHRGT